MQLLMRDMIHTKTRERSLAVVLADSNTSIIPRLGIPSLGSL
jgi:hypothetical protein